MDPDADGSGSGTANAAFRFDSGIAVLSALPEGCSIRATSRLTGVHKTTIMKLFVEVGEHCQSILDRLCNLPCSTIEADEIWTYYVRKKQGHLEPKDLGDPEAGD